MSSIDIAQKKLRMWFNFRVATSFP